MRLRDASKNGLVSKAPISIIHDRETFALGRASFPLTHGCRKIFRATIIYCYRRPRNGGPRGRNFIAAIRLTANSRSHIARFD